MNIKKILSDAPKGKEFFLHDGTKLKNLEELGEEIKFMSQEEFREYVNEEKNDFANWIEYVIGDRELAEKLRETKDKEKTFRLLNSRIIFLKIKLENQEENEINYVEREIERLRENTEREEKTLKEIKKEEKEAEENKKIIEEIERELRELEEEMRINKETEEKEKAIREIMQINTERTEPAYQKGETTSTKQATQPKEKTENRHKEIAKLIIWTLIGYIIGMIVGRLI